MSALKPIKSVSKIKVAVIVDPSLSIGLVANTVAVISIGLGARNPMFGGVTLIDKTGLTSSNSSDRAVPILQAKECAMQLILSKVKEFPSEATVVVFPDFARSLNSFVDYEQAILNRDLSKEKIDGIGLAGPSKWVNSLTGSLSLLR